VGKGTVVQELLKKVDNLWLSRSWTTRSPRQHEAPDAYFFVSEDEFQTKIDRNGFIEWAKFLDHYYGTPVPEGSGGTNLDGKDILLEIDIQGAAQVKQKFADSAKMVLLVPPDSETLLQRLSGRGDNLDHIKKRVQLAAEEIEKGRLFTDEIVVNDDLQSTVAQIAGIINRWRS
jgi:guanylate kinase